MKTKGFSIGIIFLVLLVCTTCTKDEALLTPDGERSALKAAPVENAPISIDAIDALILKIENYVSIGDLEPGIANSLISKLENAKKSLEKGNEVAAMNQLQSVLNQLENLVGNGIIDPEVGEEIIFDTEVIAGENPTFIDERDGEEYKVVLIGDQVWMAENLAFLPSVNSTDQYSYTEPHYYVYDYNGNDKDDAKLTGNYDTYGVLYNWEAAIIAAPEGWRLPSKEDIDILIEFVRSEGHIWNESSVLRSTSGWWAGCVSGTGDYRFEILPAGVYVGMGYNEFRSIGESTRFWTSTAYNDSWSYHYPHTCEYAFTRYISYWNKYWGLSVRCIKD